MRVITKKATVGFEGLEPRERLIYCLWVADYGMRNAGDLDTARDLYPNFQDEALGLARSLGLTYTAESFELPPAKLEDLYFERFERICNEVKNA